MMSSAPNEIKNTRLLLSADNVASISAWFQHSGSFILKSGSSAPRTPTPTPLGLKHRASRWLLTASSPLSSDGRRRAQVQQAPWEGTASAALRPCGPREGHVWAPARPQAQETAHKAFLRLLSPPVWNTFWFFWGQMLL